MFKSNSTSKLTTSTKIAVAILILVSISHTSDAKPVQPSKSGFNCSNWEKTINVYGTRVFMIGDRDLQLPTSVNEMETITCPRLMDASDKLKDVIKYCFKPFERTIAGMLIRGTRKTIKSKCTDDQEKQFIVKHLSCIREQSRFDLFHDILDMYNRKLIFIRDNIADGDKLDLTCCHYMEARKEIQSTAKKFCPAVAVTYALNMVDDMMREALDVACSTYQNDASKCKPVMRGNPLTGVSSRSPKENPAFLVPLIKVLAAVGQH